MRKIAVLGATGSIGIQTMGIIDRFPSNFEVVGLSAKSNIELLESQIAKYKPEVAVVADEEKAEVLKNRVNGAETLILKGEKGLEELAAWPKVDLVINGLVGFSGFKPTLAAVREGKTIALANKEALVVGGELITAEAQRRNVSILPVDSEHSAIFQSLHSGKKDEVKRIILTASGGPFRDCSREDMLRVDPAVALAHPTWKMGRKITIDSASLMNKGFEVIEAHWLFQVNFDQIDVVIHPQSIVHSMVEFVDGSIIAQMGYPDMSLPIQYALSYPERWKNDSPKFDFQDAYSLQFSPPDFELFPCLAHAYKAGKIGGTMPAVLNAADEVAVEKFLQEQIFFLNIPEILEEVMGRHTVKKDPSFNDIIAADSWSREEVEKILPHVKREF